MQGTNNPLVTLGIPTYNRAHSYLRYTLDSAVSQTYKNIEIIVSDNCSSDNTQDLVLGLKDERIKYYRHMNPVEAHENAHNCLLQARGDYFLLLHDDDLIDEDFIEVCIKSIAGRDVGLVHTGARTINSKGIVRKERRNPHTNSTTFEYFKAVLKGKAVTYFCNILYRTKYLKSVGGFQSKTYTYQDIITNIKIAHLYERIEIEEPKASYRIHDNKLGSFKDISSWCDDALFLIDVMSELLPQHADYFKHAGKKYFTKRHYSRARGISKPLNRIYAYFDVYRKFDFCYSPIKYFIKSLSGR